MTEHQLYTSLTYGTGRGGGPVPSHKQLRMDVHHYHGYVVQAVSVTHPYVKSPPSDLLRGCTGLLSNGAYRHDVLLIHHVPDAVGGENEARVSVSWAHQSGDVRQRYAPLGSVSGTATVTVRNDGMDQK